MSGTDERQKRTVPLFEYNAREKLTQRSRVNQEVLKVLRLSGRPLAPFELARLVVDANAYGRNRKIKEVLSHIKEVLVGMKSRQVVEFSGEVPAEKWGSEDTYKLTAYGRMIATTLLFNDKEGFPVKEQRKDILGFIAEYCRTDNAFIRFDFDIMESMLESGDLPILSEFFQVAIVFFGADDLKRPTPDWVRYLGEMWTAYLNFPGDTGYAEAFLKVFDSLPEHRKRIIAMYVKTRHERDWLLGTQPDEKYIRAVGRGGEAVHLPMRCPKCRDTVVVEKSVEEMYSDIAKEVRAKCPKCGSVLGRPRWVPWYGEWTGKV